jgi:uncharacterized membrane protein
MSVLIIGLVLLLGTHSISIVAPAWAERTSEAIGNNVWRSIYSVLALAGLGVTIYGYSLARAELVIFYVPPLWLKYFAIALLFFVFPILLAAFFPGRIKTALKHPMLVATKLWATAHLLANGARADVILFGAFLVWAAADRISLKRRAERPLPEAAASPRNDLIAIVAGLGLFAAFVSGLHAWLFGVPVPGPWN